MKFFIYSRKSVVTGKGDSLENQIQMCKGYITSKFEDAQESNFFVYEEEGFSGKNTQRPMFLQMLRDLDTIKPDFIVCYRLDRISRSVSDFAWLIEMLNQKEVSFLCIKEEFDTSRPMGKAMMYMASVFAQLERETIAERVRDNMRMLARGGQWLGGTPPLGFFSEKITETTKEGKTKTVYALGVKSVEMAYVRYMFQVFLEKKRVSDVGRKLIENNIRTREGKAYSHESIKLILQNPVYAIGDHDIWNYFIQKEGEVCFSLEEATGTQGVIAYNKRDYRKKNAPRQGMEKWIIALGNHAGIISGADWIRVQEILLGGEKKGKVHRIHNDYALLSSGITCGICGEKMTGKKRGQGGFDYICSTKRAKGKIACNCKNLNGRKTDQRIWTESGLIAVEEDFAEKRQKLWAKIEGISWDGVRLVTKWR